MSQKSTLASISSKQDQTARVGLVVKACAEAVRLWLESNAQTSLVRVSGHASDATGEPIVFSFQCTDRLSQADLMEFAGLAYALLAADAVRLTSLRGRQDSGQEGYECANDQDAAKRDGSMQSAMGHGLRLTPAAVRRSFQGDTLQCALAGCDKSWAPGGPRKSFRSERGQWGVPLLVVPQGFITRPPPCY